MFFSFIQGFKQQIPNLKTLGSNKSPKNAFSVSYYYSGTLTQKYGFILNHPIVLAI